MSALGQKQPLSKWEILTSEWLVLGYTGHSPLNPSGCFWEKRTLRLLNVSGLEWLLSAKSGHSELADIELLFEISSLQSIANDSL